MWGTGGRSGKKVKDRTLKTVGMRHPKSSHGSMGVPPAGPIGAQPAAEAVGVIASSKIVVARFGVAISALEFVDQIPVNDGRFADDRDFVSVLLFSENG
jgi:hypothetical protein